MESLPETVIEHMSQFLAPTDLASCCAVSHSWREMFDRDKLWRVHCDEALSQCLDVNSCAVEPHFTSPEVHDSTLSDISEWRLNYMKENRLRNNKSLGICEMVEFQPKIEGPKLVETMFFDNEYLLIFTNTELTVWDVRKIPKTLAKFSLQVQHKRIYEHCETNTHILQVKGTSKFVVVEGLVVRVFGLCCATQELQLLHVFSLVMSEKIEGDGQELLLIPFKQAFPEVSLVRNVLVGITNSEPAHKMHIWNVETGKKIKEEECPIDNMYRWFMKGCKETTNIALQGMVKVEDCWVLHWYVYSVNKLMFFSFCRVLKYVPVRTFCAYGPDKPWGCYAELYDKYIAINENGILCVYNCLTSELIHTYLHRALHFFFKNYLLYKQYFKTWHVFNPCTRRTVSADLDPNGAVTYSEEGDLAMSIVSRPLSGDNRYFEECTTIKIKDGCKTEIIMVHERGKANFKMFNQSGTILLLAKYVEEEVFVFHFW